MSRPQPPSDQRPTVEALLRLKRAERPAGEFWSEFDERLQGRLLKEFVRHPQPKKWKRRLTRWFGMCGVATAAAAAAWLAALALLPGLVAPVPAVLASHDAPAPAPVAAPARPVAAPATRWEIPAGAERHFVTDALDASRPQRHFAKVMAPEVLTTDPLQRGAEYVFEVWTTAGGPARAPLASLNNF